jgi:hypothetical protein
MSRAPDNAMVGDIILVTPSMLMVEVLFASAMLDVAVGVKLDMEGGRTGRKVNFRPSSITALPTS